MQHYLMIPYQLRDTKLCSGMSTQKINLHGEGKRQTNVAQPDSREGS